MTFSPWHWLIVIVFFGLIITAVSLEKGEKLARRKDLLVWTLGLPLVILTLNDVIKLFDGLWPRVVVIAIAWSFVFVYYRVLARRSFDAGFGKWPAIVAVVPGLNIVCIIALLIIPTKPSKTAESNVPPNSEETSIKPPIYFVLAVAGIALVLYAGLFLPHP